MDGSSQSVRLSIFGDEYSVKSDVRAETTKMVAEFVDRKMIEMKQSSQMQDKLRVAVLTAMNIAGELFEYKSKNEKNEAALKKCEALLETLTKKIDSVM